MERDFSIVSIGTERETDSKGYMCVSKYNVKENFRLLAPQEHNDQIIHSKGDNLVVRGDVSHEVITISRFQLIAGLSIPEWLSNNLCVSVIGAGSVGKGMCFELIRRKFDNIKLWSRRQISLGDISGEIECSKGWDTHSDIYVECTGEKEIIENLFTYAKPKSIIILVGTPREEPNISILDIHRKNIIVLGGHELIGWTLEDRQQIFNTIIDWHLDKKWNVESLVKKHTGTSNRKAILNKTFKETFHIMF
uniref:hypothetical protein n=1 Tax=Bacillus sp. DX2.2 TaxID=3073452 RepID=UPI00402AB947